MLVINFLVPFVSLSSSVAVARPLLLSVISTSQRRRPSAASSLFSLGGGWWRSSPTHPPRPRFIIPLWRHDSCSHLSARSCDLRLTRWSGRRKAKALLVRRRIRLAALWCQRLKGPQPPSGIRVGLYYLTFSLSTLWPFLFFFFLILLSRSFNLMRR